LSFPLKLEVQFLLSSIVQFTAGWKFYKGAYSSLKKGVGSMDTLVALGTTGAYLYSLLSYFNFINSTPFFETNVFLITFVRLGKFIEEKAKEKAIKGLKELVNLSFKKVKVLEGNREVEKNVREVFKGEKVVYRSGEQILLDGVVIKGEGLVNEAVITGEPLPVLKKEGDEVYSGAVLERGYIITKVKKTFESSFINTVRKLVEESLREKPQIQRISDKVSHYFVLFVVILSALTFLVWFIKTGEINKAVQFSLAVLVVSCPCAFGIAVPLAVSVGIYKAVKKGILPKKGSVFEVAPKVNTVIFDKTGTLTEGKLKVKEINVPKEYFEILYTMENYSNHPVAKAIREYLKPFVKEEAKLKGCEEILGVGVKCGEFIVGKGELWGKNSQNGVIRVGFGTKDKLIGEIILEDSVRKEAKEVVEFFKRRGIDVILLTGDTKENAKKIAEELGIKEVIANVKPEEKLNVIRKLQREGRKVCMVGDGVNDAPALAQSDLGIAVSEGTDLAKISGDIVIHRLLSIPEVFTLSERVYRKIKENLFWAFAYNVIFIPLATGILWNKGIYLKPEFAGLLMALSSVSVVLNTLRLIRD
ncbi:MAG: cadmium-translocating P-type ATPase, partial [Aquifex sp.]